MNWVDTRSYREKKLGRTPLSIYIAYSNFFPPAIAIVVVVVAAVVRIVYIVNASVQTHAAVATAVVVVHARVAHVVAIVAVLRQVFVREIIRVHHVAISGSSTGDVIK